MEEYVARVCWLLDRSEQTQELRERFLKTPFVYEVMHERLPVVNQLYFQSYAYIYFYDGSREVEEFVIQFDGHTLDVRKSHVDVSEFEFHEILCMKTGRF